ncbi:MAG: haloacid dehalogenase-like hydrolase [Planctomycetia bacterium]|nr:haloacid dehalogenase-like hydrolase [Planctomycetia bacterium]
MNNLDTMEPAERLEYYERTTSQALMEVRRYRKKGPIRAALFDFDGTVSLVREGWRDIMVPYFCEVLGAWDDDAEGVYREVCDWVDFLTGKQTIYQCIRLSEEVAKRGGRALEPLAYKREYHRRLLEKINGRLEGLREGKISPDTHVVPGGRAFLEMLRGAGISCYLASGTDACYVREEADLLDLTQYFDGGIYGARDDYKTFSKAMVIAQLVEQNGLGGEELVGFGDGYVEIQNVREVGGYAVGVATEETKRQGVNLWKRARLLEAGADMIVPDFTNAECLFDVLRHVSRG